MGKEIKVLLLSQDIVKTTGSGGARLLRIMKISACLQKPTTEYILGLLEWDIDRCHSVKKLAQSTRSAPKKPNI
jgi:hypothetical protein